MAEKFNLMAQIEEGANPIRLGIAAPSEDDDTYDEEDIELVDFD